jgi:hypothetical protein
MRLAFEMLHTSQGLRHDVKISSRRKKPNRQDCADAYARHPPALLLVAPAGMKIFAEI